MEPRRIPLFPLNVVLFPGMLLPLHIFEPRYQLMLRRCLEGDRTFGVCLIRAGREVGEAADPAEVGTTCEILATEPLEDGRAFLVTVGRERFRVERLVREEPYLQGDIVPLADGPPAGVEALAAEVRQAALRYARAATDLSGTEARPLALPEAPEDLSFAAAALLQVAPGRLQELLELTDTAERLGRERELLAAETERLEAVAAVRRTAARAYRPSPGQMRLN